MPDAVLVLMFLIATLVMFLMGHSMYRAPHMDLKIAGAIWIAMALCGMALGLYHLVMVLLTP